MQLIKPFVEILTPIDALAMMRRVERAGRTCYKSEDRITDDSAPQFIRTIMSKNHASVIEHESLSVRFVCDRGVSHELVRHRLMSFSQESTRYVAYDKRGAIFIIPPWCKIAPGEYGTDTLYGNGGAAFEDEVWYKVMQRAEAEYTVLRAGGWKPEQARSILPNSLKTEIVVTGNLRNWRHILTLRTSRAAHPQMREVMVMLYDQLIAAGLGVFFEDITPYRE